MCSFSKNQTIQYLQHNQARENSRRATLQRRAMAMHYRSFASFFSTRVIFHRFFVAINIRRMINTIASIWLLKLDARIFVLGNYLFLKDHSFPRATLSKNCSLLRTDPLSSQTNIRPYLRAKWGLYTSEIRHQFVMIRHVFKLILRKLRQERVLSFRKNKYFRDMAA